jgi:hypothetical protein
MGRAQGLACRSEIRARVDALGARPRGRRPWSLRPLVAGGVLGDGMGREIFRHYPHLGERIQGLAQGAGHSIESLMELFLRACRADTPGEAFAAEANVAARAGGGWIARRSEPDVGFASVEITLPWLPCAVAGVNERGIAAAIVSHPGARPSDAPSALLLVQECLQRFDDVTGCIDWSLKRPASGCARLVVAAGSGRVVAIEIDGDRRSIHEVGGETDGKLDTDLVLDPQQRSLQLRIEGGDRVTLSL